MSIYPSEQFSARPLVPGSLYGIRRWRITATGMLRGLNHGGPWVDGVNDAECLSYENFWMPHMLGKVNPKPLHRVGTLDCSCGFYAFFTHDDENHRYGTGRVVGIIEGTGIATVGSKGFRCEKARIVALIEEFRGPVRNYGVWAPRDLWPNAEPVPWHLIRDYYPGAQIMPTIDDALAKFPLSEQPDLSGVDGDE